MTTALLERPQPKLYVPPTARGLEVRKLRTVGQPGPVIHVPGKWHDDELTELVRHYDPRTDLGRLIRKLGSLKDVDAGTRGELLYLAQRSLVLESSISGIKYHGRTGEYEYLGILSRHVVTTAGVGFLVDAWQGSVEPEIMRYHGFGTDNTAEASGQTALIAEFATEYVDNQRPQGSLTEGASANIFRTVGTFAPDSGGALAVEEHAVFSQQATGGGVMFDRSLTGTVTVDSAAEDSLQITYDAAMAAGG